MLSAWQIEQLRRTAQQLMLGACTVLRLSRSSDGAGGAAETWTAVGTYPCRFRQTPKQEMEKAGTLAEDDRFQFRLPAEADIRAEDRIEYGGATYAVESVVAHDFEILTSAYCRRLP